MTESRARGHGSPGTITVHSTGGLGNQLFIYAAGAAVAAATGGRLRIDTGLHAGAGARVFELQRLGFAADYVDLGRRTPRYGLRGRLDRGSVPHGCTYREPDLSYDDDVLRQHAGGCLFGHFQSWRYVEAAAARLRAQFEWLAAARSDRLEGVAERMHAGRGIALHVRRGDYVHSDVSAFHGIAGPQYYLVAVEHLRRMGFDGPLHVFSDDPTSAARELSAVGDLDVISDGTLDAVDEILLMSRAPALVTANSSFSWWGGWLGGPGRPVIAPRPWFDTKSVDPRDLLPPSWLTVDRRD